MLNVTKPLPSVAAPLGVLTVLTLSHCQELDTSVFTCITEYIILAILPYKGEISKVIFGAMS